jgi:hypothetical protein
MGAAEPAFCTPVFLPLNKYSMQIFFTFCKARFLQPKCGGVHQSWVNQLKKFVKTAFA